MKTNRFKTLWGAALGLVLLAAVPFIAQAQSAASAAPNGANPAWGFPGFGNPFMRPVPDDGPTDGKDHPNYHISTPVEIKLPSYERTSIDVRARIDRQAGFRLEATTLSYQNYAVNPEKSADAAPVLFGGKFAEDVSVNDTNRTKNKWTNLLQPFRNAFDIPKQGPGKPFDPSFDTFISFEPGGCEITLVEHDKSLEVIAANPKAEPARFRFTLSNGDPSADRKKDEKKDSQKGGFGSTNGPRSAAAAATGSTDGTAHPDTPLIAPVEFKAFKPEQKIVIKGTVDQSCGFQIKGNTMSYLNSKTTKTPGALGYSYSGPSKLTFGGKYASGVTVNGEAWTSLNRPLTLKATLKKDSVKYITFKGPSCSFDYRKCGDAVAVFIGNYDKNAYQDKPAQFEIVLYFADPADSTGAARTE